MKKRGEIWWVNFDPSIGQEIKKKRPAIILSNNVSNKFLDRYQVIPLSSKTRRLYPSETIVQIEGKPGKAMADQIMTVSSLRFIRKIGKVDHFEMAAIENIIKRQLDL